jgi:hypothetical protein
MVIFEEIKMKFDGFISPTQCLQEAVTAYTDYLKIAEEEKTKRREIEAEEKVMLAAIKARRDVLITYLERSFDERATNFQALFVIIDQAIHKENNAQLALTLNTLTELAKSSPFKELSNLASVQAALADPDHKWEF